MKSDRLNVLLAMLLSALNESKDGAPSGTMYAALMAGGYSLDEYNYGLGLLERSEMVETKAHWCRLTDKGKKLADQIDKTVRAAAAKGS